MANTVASLPTVNKYDVSKFILEPLFMGQDYMSYMDIMPNVSGTVVIDKFKQLGGITNAFSSSAFTAETGEIGDTVTITPVRREAEIAFAGNSLYNKIKGQLMRGGHEFDNVDGTIVKNILLDLIGQGVKADFNKHLWLSDASASDAFGDFDGLFDAAFAVTANRHNRGTLATEQTTDAALVAGRGLDILKGLYEIASPELLEAGNHVYFVSGDIADDYMATNLENSSFAAAGYGAMVNGVPNLTYRGIPIIVRRDWDVAIAANVANINGASTAVETHRAMLTTKDAFVVATDFNENSVEQWYSNDNKEYRFRVSYSIGCALKDAKLATYYTPDNMS
tara:strand:+ start:1739 stop:2749 length:1011 start_codon:yes stop_codon:yes gene_type:complete